MNARPILWNSMEAAALTGGRSTAEWAAGGIALNAADVRPGDLFFAAKEDELAEAFLKGAAAAVVPWGVGKTSAWPLLVVGDPFDALLSLAKAGRFRTHAYVVAAQGGETRKTLEALLGGAFAIYSGARHISQGLAALPENAEFALFGFSPQARPDIAVVMNGAHGAEAVFAAMPPSGRVLINADGGGVMETVAAARAAGIRNIFTFGHARDADAALVDELPAANGARVRLRVMGETLECVLPPGKTATLPMLAGALILNLWGVPGASIARILAGGRPEPAAAPESNITLMDTAPAQAAFRVSNMIDLGFGRRTAVLESVTPAYNLPLIKGFEIPRKLDNLNLMYACKGIFLLSDAERAIRKNSDARLEKIAPDAQAPGDFLAFRDLLDAPRKLAYEALRLVRSARAAC